MNRTRPGPPKEPAQPAQPARRPATRGGVLLVLALFTVLGVALTRPAHAPPLYDGLGFPDEPYRWIAPPAGSAATKAPTRATVSVPVTGGGSAAARAFSGESGPQIAFAVAQGSFAVPAGSRSVSVTALPLAAPPPPTGGVVVSNLYRIEAVAAATPVSLAAGKTMVVNLRANTATAQAVVLEQFSGTGWSQVPTSQVGTDIYAALIERLTPMALVKLDRGVAPTVGGDDGGSAAGPTTTSAAAPTLATGSSGTTTGVWIGLGALLALLAAALAWLRVRAGGSHEGDE